MGNPLTGLMMTVSLAALAFGGGAVIGYKFKAGQDAGAVIHQAVKTEKAAIAQGAINTATALQAQAAHDRIIYRTVTLIKEIHDVIPPQVDIRFALPVGLVRVHDSAALGLDLSAVPDPAGRPDDAPSPVAASHLGAVIAANYGACNVDIDQLTRLQGWIDQQAALAAGH